MARVLESLVASVWLVACSNGGADQIGEKDHDEGREADPHDTTSTVEADAGGESPTEVTYPVPVRPVPAEYLPQEYPFNLAPSVDCVHPQVNAACAEGWCRVLPGCFVMGAPRDRPFATSENLQVQVTLTHTIEVGETEVTNAQWLAEGFEFPLRDFDVWRCSEAECPITNVNFYEVLTFLNRYSEARNLQPCYELSECSGTFGSGPICNRMGMESGDLECDRTGEDGLLCEGVFATAATPYACEGYRLPTEAEWEYVSRGGSIYATWLGNIGWQEPTGPDCQGPNPNLDPAAWYCWNAEDRVHEVKQKWPNPWGVFDILGNVSEWSTSAGARGDGRSAPLVDPVGYWYDNFGYEERALLATQARGSSLIDAQSPALLGGNAAYSAHYVTSESRASSQAYRGHSLLGFRMVRTIF